MVKANDQTKRKVVDYADNSFVAFVHYGGKFIKNKGRLKFTGKQKKCYRGLSKEKWSMFAICALADDIGLKCCLDVYWKSEVGPFTMKNVHQLRNDSNVFNILESIPANENVHIYLADKADKEELSEELFEDCSEAEEVGEGVSDAVEKDTNVEEPATVDEDANVEESRKDAKEHDTTCNVEEAYETIVEDVNVEEPELVEDTNVEEPETVVEDVNIEESEKDANEHDAHDAAAENILEVEDVVEEDACSNEVGGGNTIAGDAEPAMVEEGESEMNEEEEDVDSGFFYSDSDVGEDEVAQADVSHTVVQNLEGLYGDWGTHANENENDNETDGKGEGSDSFHSVHGSDSDGHTCPEFNTDCDLENPKFKVVLVFPNKAILKEAINQYGRKIGISRFLTLMTNEDFEQFIKTFKDVHTCAKVMKNPNITCKFIAKTYLHKFLADRNYAPSSLKADAEADYVAILNSTKCLRARKLAIEMIDGSYKDQFKNLYDYLGELRETSPGTTNICQLDNRLFERVYICPQACKNDYKAGCRPIISLDGCFLKGPYIGWLLAAVGIDANDGIYPIAYAVVESEKFSAWYWFLSLLKDYLEILNSNQICFMSDRQKGLKEALDELFPDSEQRNCVRHIYTNFKTKETNRGKTLKDVLWKAARSTYVTQFTTTMNEMKAISKDAHDWFVDKAPSMWSKSHFSTRSKCDMLLNNLSECFNMVILEARDKPILTMLEIIRTKMMRRIVQKREEAEKYTGILYPRIQKKLDNQIQNSVTLLKLEMFVHCVSRCRPIYAGNFQYQVECGQGEQHVVNIQKYTCTCRRWDLTGIPCNHAISVINCNNMNVVSFVDPCYKDTQLSIYGHYICPIRGVNQWTKVEGMEPILPPVLRRPVGRPNKKRRLERDEVPTSRKLSKRGSKMTCTKCGKTGHNIRTCKGEIGGNKYLKKSAAFKAEVANKRQSKINPPTTSKPTFCRGQSQPPSVMNVRWMMTTQESYVSNPPAQASNAHD
ncbi:hypothetical protein GQ457_14G014140 [Hibiscus cannabinus]